MPDLDRGHLAQILVSACGLWLMASPDVLGYGGATATSDRVVGPLLVTIGGIAVWEVARPVRLAALPLALWLLIAPWLFNAPTEAIVSNMSTGVAAGLLCLVRGRPADAFGGGWRAVWSSPSPYEDVKPRQRRATKDER